MILTHQEASTWLDELLCEVGEDFRNLFSVQLKWLLNRIYDVGHIEIAEKTSVRTKEEDNKAIDEKMQELFRLYLVPELKKAIRENREGIIRELRYAISKYFLI